MPQIYVILDKYVADNFCPGEAIDTFFHKLVPVVEKRFGLEGKNDVAITVVRAVRSVNEANIQVEIRYTAGTDEYGTGVPFDPTVGVQEALIEDIYKTFQTSPRLEFYSPRLTLSVWCKPYYGGAFKMFK
jgi:hypothetical protein